jgi:CxxC motif-containing protein (DUF1111 family)
MRSIVPCLLGCALGCAAAACSGGHQDKDEELSGGENGTVFNTTRDAFAQAFDSITGEHEMQFFLGNSIFNRAWVTAPASVRDFDGLGPLFNATNCSACHFKDGRGHPPRSPDEALVGLLIRISVPGTDAHGGPKPEPNYGTQIEGNAIRGVPREAVVKITYQERPGEYADGEAFSLRKPHYAFGQLGYGPLAADVMVSPRVAPAMIGLGLLEAVPESTLEELADPDDEDGDGISGRINHVWSVKAKKTVVGRFGWKANQPTLEQQTTGAFQGDMGITTELFPEQECTEAEVECREARSGGGAADEPDAPEASPQFVAAVVDYAHNLAVPARRNWTDPEVVHGKHLFEDIGCGGCHVGRLETGTLEGFPELEHQTIRPYTDLLLHDMGEGLADHRPDYEADGREWRTAPLWGIGLVETVNSHQLFLHDGRARGLAEAVLWHGGEAQAARDAFVKLTKAERRALLAFLASL